MKLILLKQIVFLALIASVINCCKLDEECFQQGRIPLTKLVIPDSMEINSTVNFQLNYYLYNDCGKLLDTDKELLEVLDPDTLQIATLSVDETFQLDPTYINDHILIDSTYVNDSTLIYTVFKYFATNYYFAEATFDGCDCGDAIVDSVFIEFTSNVADTFSFSTHIMNPVTFKDTFVVKQIVVYDPNL
ncbi:MAG: hypothetical protein JEZ09_01825 [Salinivirgaceae bacterium]|nr:hypothetical protein [Salinivirgaceae bacterium]